MDPSNINSSPHVGYDGGCWMLDLVELVGVFMDDWDVHWACMVGCLVQFQFSSKEGCNSVRLEPVGSFILHIYQLLLI